MNVRIKNQFLVKTGIWINDEFVVNNYTVICNFITTSQNDDDHIVCLSRINFLFDEFDNSCFINQNNQKKIKQLKNCKIKVIELPEEPVDQIIGLVMYYKINAICEQRMRCTDLDISSEVGENICYLHSEYEETSVIPKVGWWHESGPSLTFCNRQSQEKIVKFTKIDTWQQYDLNWAIEESQSASIHNINNEN